MFSKTNSSATAIIVAAGNSSRMGNSVNKQFLLIDDKPVLAHTLLSFNKSASVSKIIVVTKPDSILTVWDMVKEFNIDKVSEIVPGGSTRQESVKNGLCCISDDCLVAVHDGARPFITSTKIDELVSKAEKFGAVAPGVLPKDTIKAISGEGIVAYTPDRSTLRLIQTPQIFDSARLKMAYAYADETGFVGTDDCSVAENAGIVVHIVDGEYTNIKVTTPEDMITANSVFEYLKENKL